MLLVVIDGLGLFLLVVFWLIKIRMMVEFGCSFDMVVCIILVVVFSDFCLVVGVMICCVNWL